MHDTHNLLVLLFYCVQEDIWLFGGKRQLKLEEDKTWAVQIWKTPDPWQTSHSDFEINRAA